MTPALELCCQFVWLCVGWRLVPPASSPLARIALAIGVATGLASVAWYSTTLVAASPSAARILELAVGLGAVLAISPLPANGQAERAAPRAPRR